MGPLLKELYRFPTLRRSLECLVKSEFAGAGTWYYEGSVRNGSPS